MKKRYLLALFLAAIMLFAFTSCDDSDSSSSSGRACTDEENEIVRAIMSASDSAATDNNYTVSYDYSASAANVTYKSGTYSVTDSSGDSVSVTISSGSTCRIVYSSTTVFTETFTMTAKVDGITYSLYLVMNVNGSSYTLGDVVLDGEKLTGIDLSN